MVGQGGGLPRQTHPQLQLNSGDSQSGYVTRDHVHVISPGHKENKVSVIRHDIQRARELVHG